MDREVVIEGRFRGPPNSGNGGYSCGVAAEGIEGPVAVTLRVPPPLDVPMMLSGDGLENRLEMGATLIAEARRTVLDGETPLAPALAEAADAVERYAGFVDHPFATCFVCGPEREPGDGLRIFPGRTERGNMVAAPWTPDESLATVRDDVHRRHVWAALDCPSYFALPGRPMALLGRLRADIARAPRVGEPLIAFAQHDHSEGRKHRSRSALATADGEVIARAEVTWIEVAELPT